MVISVIAIVWNMAGTTPKARAIGAELRRVREDAGLSARQLAEKLGLSHTTVGRWEKGERVPRPVDVATVLSALDADNALREELVELSRSTDGQEWIAIGLPEQQRQLSALLEFERDAKSLTAVSSLLIPGLLQTSSYARAIIGAGGVPEHEVEPRVAVRIGRRDALTRQSPSPVQLNAVIDESALQRVIGGHQVMTEQLRFLLTAAEWPTVDLRVVPTETDWHPGLEGPFLLVDRGSSAVVQIESRRSSLFFHKPDDVNAYRDAVDWIRAVALSPEESSQTIADALNAKEAAQ